MSVTPVLSLDDILSKTTDLPVLSQSAIAVIAEADAADTSADRLATALGRDPALAAQVLRLANSAFYGLPRRVASIPHAVMLLGSRAVRNLALAATTHPWMRRPLPGYALGAEQLWQHALGTAIGAAYVAERSGKAIPDTTFTAGLLHDIGKLAMSVWLDRKLSALLKIAEIEGTPFDQVERRVLGYDHTEVGEHLVRKWNLPESLVMPVRWHHRPDEAPAGNPMVDCVHLADYFSMAMGLGIGGDGMRYVLSEGSFTRLSLSLDALPEMVSDFVERYARQSAAFHEVTT